VYVLEEEPGFIDYNFKQSGVIWSHKVWAPWRYFIINVRYDTRVEGGNVGYMYFASERLKSMDDQDLRTATLPNLFENGGICLGYTVAIFDRTPVRSAWRAVRAFYGIPGNQWLVHGSDMPNFIKESYPPVDSEDHQNHRYNDRLEFGCKWSALPKETVITHYNRWTNCGKSPMDVIRKSDWRYQKGSVYDPLTLDRVLREKGITL
jgi:hypothetical protein